MRGLQEARLAAMQALGSWPRYQRRLEQRWDGAAVARLVAARAGQSKVVAPDAIAALRGAIASGILDGDALRASAARFRARDFAVLGARVPAAGPLPWHTDWRWDQTWPAMYYRHYDLHHADRSRPYDVKIPWEISRLLWLVPMVQAALVERDFEQVGRDLAIVADWEQRNPLAHTVNWYPMEASMRGIALVLVLEMALAGGAPHDAIPPALVRLVAAHGTFVSRTNEFNDLHSNHYTANLVALLLSGLALRGFEREADGWIRHATAELAGEIEQQYCSDGVNIEKSLPYHRFVTELFLVAAIVLERAGLSIPRAALERLHAAARYARLATRPDGLLPNVGDNDGASLLELAPGAGRDARPLLSVAATFFKDGDLEVPTGQMPPAVGWLLGEPGVAAWRALAPGAPSSRFFPDGGVAVVRDREHFLWMDVGEVGLGGRGGHGHNDLLSFELALGGRPVVVDPGCFVYTGDAAARNRFRGTAYHNALRIDGREIAPLSGTWTIGPDAVPINVRGDVTGGVGEISAGHLGYRSLPDPVTHARTVRFDAGAGHLTCVDRLTCAGSHAVERFLHFASSIELEIGENGARASDHGLVSDIRWNGSASARVDDEWVSEEYGVRHPAKVLVLTEQITGDTDLWLEVTARG